MGSRDASYKMIEHVSRQPGIGDVQTRVCKVYSLTVHIEKL